MLLQYPGVGGAVHDLKPLIDAVHAKGGIAIVAADLLALTLLVPPGELGADICVGNTQRFGMPMGNGGPHAAYLATKDEYKRSMPGRLVGVSVDTHGAPAYRLALQTREQHIRREKATKQHLHGAGAAGRRRQHVRRLPRARGTAANRPPRRQLHRGARRRAPR